MKIFLKIPSFAKAYCSLFDHKFIVSKNVTEHILEYKCSHCKVEMTNTADGFLVQLTPKFRETNEYISQIYNRRRERSIQYGDAY